MFWMPVISVSVSNFRSIVSTGQLDLGPITVLIGPNNSGKSSLLRAVHMVQGGGRVVDDDIRIGEAAAQVSLRLSEPYPTAVGPILRDVGLSSVEMLELTAMHSRGGVNSTDLHWSDDTSRGVNIPPTRPNHLTVPAFSRRKSQEYETAVRLDLANEVDITDRSLTSLVANLTGGEHGEGQRYRDLMKRVLGLEVTTFLAGDGQVPGLAVAPGRGIALTRMGEGVSSLVGIMANLASPGRRLFLIEEPENDLHPTALRALLDVLKEEAVKGHQFMVTTHNDIVLRELGALPEARIYEARLASGQDGLPATTYVAVADPFDRETALRNLGYEQNVPFGWLVLEEASGETFVGDALIPLFTPKLAALRTVSAAGVGNLRRRVDALHSMVLFAHLATEDPRAWVLADGDPAGKEAIADLKQAYKSWPPGRFRAHERENIEDFYPPRFAESVAAVRAATGWRERAALKAALVREVRTWALTTDDAMGQLEKSAAPLIAVLRDIEAEISRGPV
jgi:predicted ATPase